MQMFCGESLRKIDAKGVALFRKGAAHEIQNDKTPNVTVFLGNTILSWDVTMLNQNGNFLGMLVPV